MNTISKTELYLNDKSLYHHFKSEVSSSAKFKLNNEEPNLKVAYLNVIQAILLRESYLTNLLSLSNGLNDLYWRYAYLKLVDRLGNKNELLMIRKKVIIRQDEFAVAVAHYRASSIEVLEYITIYRKLACRFIEMKVNISILWHGINYLNKMKVDYKILNDIPIIKLWLGFEPNVFMICDNHIWNELNLSQRQFLFDDWYDNHIAFKKNKRRNATTVDSLEVLNQSSSVLSIQSEPTLPFITELSNVNDSLKKPNFGNQETEMIRLKSFFNSSFTNSENSFWADYSHSLALANIILGIKELNPMTPLVPELPAELVAKCKMSETILFKEIKIENSSEKFTDQSTIWDQNVSLDSVSNCDQLNFSFSESNIFKSTKNEFGMKSFKSSDMFSSSKLLKEKSSELKLNEQKLESKIMDRQFTQKVCGIHKLIERRRRCNRDKPVPIDLYVAVIIVQKFLRRAISMRRLKEKKIARMRWNAILIIQQLIRSFLARKRFLKESRLFKSTVVLLRKYVIRKQFAAFKITNFMRRAVYICNKTRELSKEKLINQHVRFEAYKNKAKEIDRACRLFQNVWRGFVARRRIRTLKTRFKKQQVADSHIDSYLRKSISTMPASEDQPQIMSHFNKDDISETSSKSIFSNSISLLEMAHEIDALNTSESNPQSPYVLDSKIIPSNPVAIKQKHKKEQQPELKASKTPTILYSKFGVLSLNHEKLSDKMIIKRNQDSNKMSKSEDLLSNFIRTKLFS